MPTNPFPGTSLLAHILVIIVGTIVAFSMWVIQTIVARHLRARTYAGRALRDEEQNSTSLTS